MKMMALEAWVCLRGQAGMGGGWKRMTVFGSKFFLCDYVITHRGAQKEQTTLYALCAINGPCCVLYAFQQKVVILMKVVIFIA